MIIRMSDKGSILILLTRAEVMDLLRQPANNPTWIAEWRDLPDGGKQVAGVGMAENDDDAERRFDALLEGLSLQ